MTISSWFIDPIHKWLAIKNSFVSIKISPAHFVFELIIQKNFCFQTRLVWPNWQSFMNRVNSALDSEYCALIITLSMDATLTSKTIVNRGKWLRRTVNIKKTNKTNRLRLMLDGSLTLHIFCFMLIDYA